MTTNGTPADQIVFVTKDGKIFIPQVIDIEQMKTEFKNFQAQQQNGAVQPTETVPAEGTAEQPAEDANANVNTNAAPVQE
jgi:hypothetical protein